MLYLLFAGRHGRPAGSTGSLVAAFGSPEEARAAFRQIRLSVSDAEGWAELSKVAEGRRARRLSWFGQDRRPVDGPAWPVSVDAAAMSSPGRRRPRLPWFRSAR